MPSGRGWVPSFATRWRSDRARREQSSHIYPERYRGARRALLRRFPYVLWYRSYDTFVVVLACVHGKRDSRSVRARLLGGG